jgi:hypothetical protein
VIPINSQKSNRWREFYNPLRGLSLPKLVSLMESGERGQYADLQWLYYYMERSDPMIFSVLQRRRAALLDSDWDIRQVAEVQGSAVQRFSGSLWRWSSARCGGRLGGVRGQESGVRKEPTPYQGATDHIPS